MGRVEGEAANRSGSFEKAPIQAFSGIDELERFLRACLLPTIKRHYRL